MRYVEESRYPRQAATYDATRSASPTVTRLLLRFLGEGRGRTLLDVAGGTGNYAEAVARAGFRPTIIDLTPAMLARSAPKIGAGRQVVGDAMRLPVRDGGVDTAMCVSALHQFPDQEAATRELRRVIRHGPAVLQVFTKENLIPMFAGGYFRSDQPPSALHMSTAEITGALLRAGFSQVEHDVFVYTDTADATFSALHVDPRALADEELLRNTSFFQRLVPEARRAGLVALRRDLDSGRLGERVEESLRLATVHGHGAVLAAWP